MVFIDHVIQERSTGSWFRPQDFSLSDGEIIDIDYAENDPLDCLDDIITPAPPSTSDHQGDFQ